MSGDGSRLHSHGIPRGRNAHGVCSCSPLGEHTPGTQKPNEERERGRPSGESRRECRSDSSEQDDKRATALKPFLKWVGGKSKLLPELLARVPARYGRFYEPFAGGAAMFFALAAKRAPARAGEAWAVIGDSNADLIATYRAVRDDVEELISILELYRRDHSETQYAGTRTLFNMPREREAFTPVQRAAAFIYLNKTCFNGLWRVNADGAFNVPMGRYQNPKIFDADSLRAASRALIGADLRAGNYPDCKRTVSPNDFVYFDPPYVPVSKTANFTSYTSGGFDEEEQRALARHAVELGDCGVHVMLSNSDTPLVREIYAGFHLTRVMNTRSVNSDPTKRGAVAELIITNYEPSTTRSTVSEQKTITNYESTTPPEHIEQFFEYQHLPPHLQAISKRFAELAQFVLDNTPRNPERTVALRKLLEGKDAAVRAAIAR